MEYLNKLVQELRVLSQVRSTLDILTLLFKGLPNFLNDSWRIIKLFGNFWITFKVKLRDMRIRRLNSILLVI